MCRLHSAASGPLKLADVLKRAGLEDKAAVVEPVTKKEIVYSTNEVAAAREVLERLLNTSTLGGNRDSVEMVVDKVTI